MIFRKDHKPSLKELLRITMIEHHPCFLQLHLNALYLSEEDISLKLSFVLDAIEDSRFN